MIFFFLSLEMKDYSIYLTLFALNYKLIVNLNLLLGVIKIQIINHDIHFTQGENDLTNNL